jgi:high-affinity Fe2+/Pb2+ permease
MELGRIVLMIDGDSALFIRRTWLTKIFVAGDILSFLTQSSGAGLLSSGNSSSIDTGQNIVVGGLFIQVIFFGMFVVASAIFHFRMNQMPTAKSYELPWKKHMLSLYLVSLLIFMRSIVRVVEFLEGYGGYIMRHEAFLYVFDALVMWLAVVTMNWIHPGEVARELRAAKGGRAAPDMVSQQEHELPGRK